MPLLSPGSLELCVLPNCHEWQSGRELIQKTRKSLGLWSSEVVSYLQKASCEPIAKGRYSPSSLKASMSFWLLFPGQQLLCGLL